MWSDLAALDDHRLGRHKLASPAAWWILCPPAQGYF